MMMLFLQKLYLKLQLLKLLDKMNMYKEKAAPLIKQYEEKFGPLKKSATESNNWSWIKAPWPWESEEDC